MFPTSKTSPTFILEIKEVDTSMLAAFAVASMVVKFPVKALYAAKVAVFAKSLFAENAVLKSVTAVVKSEVSMTGIENPTLAVLFPTDNTKLVFPVVIAAVVAFDPGYVSIVDANDSAEGHIEIFNEFPKTPAYFAAKIVLALVPVGKESY